LRVRFVLEEAVVEVDVSDLELAKSVARLFPGARILDSAEGSPGRKVLERGVTSDADGFYFSEGGTTAAFDSVSELTAEVEFSVVTALLEQHSRCTHLHAAAAWTPRGAVVVTGNAGAGKSSCALAWSISGLPLFGDDVIRVGLDGLVAPFPRLLKVPPDRLPEFGLDTSNTLFWHPEDEVAWFDPDVAGGWMDQVGEAALVAQIAYDGGDDVRITEVDDVEGLRILLDSVQTAGLSREKSVDGFIGLLNGARVVRVRYGSSREMARLLAEMVMEGAPPLTGPSNP
jgi:hypothetical protein